jgi:hypothetical protein
MWATLRSYTVAGIYVGAGVLAGALAIAGARLVYTKVRS